MDFKYENAAQFLRGIGLDVTHWKLPNRWIIQEFGATFTPDEMLELAKEKGYASIDIHRKNTWFEVRKSQDGVLGAVWDIYDDIEVARQFIKENPDPRSDFAWHIVKVTQEKELIK